MIYILCGFLTVVGGVGGACIGAICYAFPSDGVPQTRIMVISSILTAVVVGIATIIFY